MAYRLILNPGSTSTKLAVYRGREELFTQTLQHPQAEIEKYAGVVDQKDFRSRAVRGFLAEKNVNPGEIEGVIAIGGLIRPGDAGVYEVTPGMVADLTAARYNEHASNLGALIAADLAAELGLKAYVADAVTTDEMQPAARLSGLPEITRLGRSHALNQKSVAAMAAAELGLAYAEARLVVAHLGGGISITAHRRGRMVDTNAARGEGPFCIDRTGGLNSYELARLCFSGKYSQEEMLRKIAGNGGVVAYLGTRDFREVTQRMRAGDVKAAGVFEAMAYQVAKEIAAMTVPLEGRVDALVLTGGMANSEEFTGAIAGQVGYLGRVLVFPGEREMEALAGYLDEVLAGRRAALNYQAEGGA